uniref:Tudor domain-containing protein n=1 Tax=Romanomermis culicivorax TaxID=13658 RepID=A0A915KI91_ROMCU
MKNEADLVYLTRYGPARKVSRGRQICICVIAYSPKKFYLVTDDDMLQNLRFTHQMERLYAQDLHFLNFSELVVGMPVAARYIGGDLAWYRAKLVSFDVEKNQCQVEFVDYAHSQSNNLQQLRSMPLEIAKYPPMALECKLIVNA